MKFLQLLLLSLIFLSCRNPSEKGEKKVSTEAPEENEIYTSQEWHFSAEVPEGYKVVEGQLPGGEPVINVFEAVPGRDAPMGIQDRPGGAYLAVFPEGAGLEAPAGPRKSLSTWNGHLDLPFEVDRDRSQVYLLENGQPWALELKFNSAPAGWAEMGSIFAFFEVEDLEVECFSSNTGEKISAVKCNPSDGDTMKFSGNVSEGKNAQLFAILGSIELRDSLQQHQPIEELIQVAHPQVGQKVDSPLKISGKARGFWFFEASAPVSLISESGEELSSGFITATDNWMTEEWVPFEAELDFQAKEKRGYLKFNRANASGKPEHDRVLRVPVIF